MKKLKLVLGVILVLAILGLVFTSDFGQPVGEFITGNLGGMTSLFAGAKGPSFGVDIKVNRESIYGQTFKISNSSINLLGVPSYLSLNQQTLSLKESQVVNLIINNFKGSVIFYNDGSVGISGETNYLEMDNLVFSSDKPKKIELNVGSNSLSIDGFNSDKISLISASGTVDRTVDSKIDTVSFDGKLEVSNFVGGLLLSDSTAEFFGTATSVKGDKFSFV